MASNLIYLSISVSVYIVIIFNSWYKKSYSCVLADNTRNHRRKPSVQSFRHAQVLNLFHCLNVFLLTSINLHFILNVFFLQSWFTETLFYKAPQRKTLQPLAIYTFWRVTRAATEESQRTEPVNNMHDNKMDVWEPECMKTGNTKTFTAVHLPYVSARTQSFSRYHWYTLWGYRKERLKHWLFFFVPLKVFFSLLSINSHMKLPGLNNCI